MDTENVEAGKTAITKRGSEDKGAKTIKLDKPSPTSVDRTLKKGDITCSTKCLDGKPTETGCDMVVLGVP